MTYSGPNQYNAGTYNAGGGAGVNPPTITASVTPSTGQAPLLVTLTWNSAVGGAPLSSAQIAWGDGVNPTGLATSGSAQHTYNTNGSFVITVTVTDTAGQTGSASASVNLNVPVTPPLPGGGGYTSFGKPTWHTVNPRPTCAPRTVQAVQLQWAGGVVPSGGSFVAWHLERADDSSGYHEIAAITTIGIREFIDYEPRRNTSAAYRIRMEADSGFSSYGIAAPVVVPACCGYTLTSNEDPTLNIARDDIGTREYEFPEEPAAQIWPLHSRDNVAVFRELEDRGDAIKFQLLLFSEGTASPSFVPPDRGRQAFEIVKGLMRAPVSYICVCDEDGSRWYSALMPDSPTAVRKEPEGMYTASLKLREVSSSPSVVDVVP